MTEKPFADNLTELNPEQQGLVTAIHNYTEEGLNGNEIIEKLKEIYSPPLLFHPKLLELPVIYQMLRDFLKKKGATFKPHPSKRVMPILCNTLFEGSDLELGMQHIRDYQSGKVISNEIEKTSFARPSEIENNTKTAHNMALRFKDEKSKFTGAIGESWSDYLNEYLYACNDYSVTNDKRLQYLYHILKDDAKNFYNDNIKGKVSSFQETCAIMNDEYNSFTRQSRIRNHLNRLRVTEYMTKGHNDTQALELVHRTICKLHKQGPLSYRSEAHKIDYLRNAVMGMTWARDPLCRIAPMQLTYQQLYSQLEASIQQMKDEKTVMLSDRANYNLEDIAEKVGPQDQGEPFNDKVPGVLFTGQARYGVNPRQTKKRACFNCGMTNHLIRDCRKPIKSKYNAQRRMQDNSRGYYSNNDAKQILFELCEQLDISTDEAIVHTEEQKAPEPEYTEPELPVVRESLLVDVANTLQTAAQEHADQEVMNIQLDSMDF